MKYLLMQMKQFTLSSIFMLVAVFGLTVSNSFDQTYMAKVEQVQEQHALEKYAGTDERPKSKDEKEKTGVAMK